MMFNASSLLTCNLYILAFSIMLYWLRRKGYYYRVNFTFLIISLLVVLLRLAVPVEYPFAKTLYTAVLFPLMNLIYSSYDFGIICFSPWQAFLGIWCIGILFNGITFLWKNYRFIRFQKQISRFDDPVLEPVLERLSNEYIRLDKYRFYRLPFGTSACCTGFFRHKIYLPDATYTETELFYVLRHEIAHCRNHDLLIRGCLEFIRIIQWWNPLIYWLKKNTDQLLEIRADADAVHGFDQHQISEYAECLLKTALLSPIKVQQVQTSMYENNTSILKIRCQQILNIKDANDRSTKQKWDIIFLTIVGVFWFLSFFIVVNSYLDTTTDHDGSTVFNSEDMYAIQTENGYEIFANHELMGTLDDLPSTMFIPIYTNLSEVP